MNRPATVRNTLWIGAVLLALPACGTEEIAAPITYVGTEAGPDRGELSISVAPTAETYEEDQAQAQGSQGRRFIPATHP